MRRTLVHAPRALAALAWLAATSAYAQAPASTVTARVTRYADDNRTTVVSPRVIGNGRWGGVTGTVGYDLDAVTTASVDVVTAASPLGYSEKRHGVSAGAATSGINAVRGTLAGSFEPDYRSLGGTLGYARQLLGQTATFDTAATLTVDRIGRAGESLDLRRHAGKLDATFSWPLGPLTVADLGWSAALVDGYQANPYRYVRVAEAVGGAAPVAVPEAVPERRWRGALVGRVRQALGLGLFAHAEYRFYGDSWGLGSHTGELQALASLLGERVTVRARARAYRQSGASFYRESYTTLPYLPRYRTSDKEMTAGSSFMGGLHLDARLPGRARALRVAVDLDRALFVYDHFARLPQRAAWIAGVGLEVIR